jgi:hypothetical protein
MKGFLAIPADVIRLIGRELSDDDDFVRFGATCQMTRRALQSRLARIHYVRTVAQDFTVDEWQVVKRTRAKIMDERKQMAWEMLHEYVNFSKIDRCRITRKGWVTFFWINHHWDVEQEFDLNSTERRCTQSAWTQFQLDHPLLFSKREEILQRVDAIFNNK